MSVRAVLHCVRLARIGAGRFRHLLSHIDSGAQADHQYRHRMLGKII